MFEFPRQWSRRIALFALAAFFVGAGVNHFANAAFYLKIMPPWLPAHLALVYLSGFFEILGGLAVLVRRTRALAGWGLIVLLLAVYPANLHMALHPEQFPEVPVSALYLRLPLQFLFIVWALWATRPDGSAGVRRPA